MIKFVVIIALISRVFSLSRDPDEPPNPISCSCSDVDPRDDFTRVNVPYTCWQQANFVGVCNQPFMLATPEVRLNRSLSLHSLTHSLIPFVLCYSGGT